MAACMCLGAWPAAADLSTPRVDAERAEWDAQVERELAGVAADAVPLLREAQAAADAGAHAKALELYERVLERAPEFHHALRRSCAIRATLGDHAKALQLCREALALKASPENKMALAWALAEGGGPDDHAEARRLAREAVAAEPNSLYTQMQAAQLGLMLDDMPLFQPAAKRLRELAPDEMPTPLFSAIAAGLDGDLDLAESELERAHAAGLDDSAYHEFRARIADARPVWHAPLQFLKWGALAWFSVAALLIVFGVVLSRATLAAATRLPADGSAGTEGRGLRRAYAAVLLASCVFYYLSLPLVLLVVLAAGGGLILAFLAFGVIPIKLTIIVVIITLATMFVVLKNMFVRGTDSDPGQKLDLAPHPRLRGLLDAIAGKIDTRPVDSVYLTPDTTIAVTERGGMLKQLRGASERALILGVGVLDGMKVGELSAILAHEYGHFSNRDTAGGGLALAVRRSLLHTAIGLAQGGSASWWNPAWLFVNAFHRVFLRVSQGASRLQEIMADRWAARAYGPALFERGMRHVIRREIEFDARSNATLREVIAAQRPLANLYAYKPASEPELDVDELMKKAMESEPSPYDSHPRPTDRIAWIQPIHAEGDPPPDAEAESWTLFADREQIERSMTAQVRMNIAAHHGVQIAAEAPTGA